MSETTQSPTQKIAAIRQYFKEQAETSERLAVAERFQKLENMADVVWSTITELEAGTIHIDDAAIVICDFSKACPPDLQDEVDTVLLGLTGNAIEAFQAQRPTKTALEEEIAQNFNSFREVAGDNSCMIVGYENGTIIYDHLPHTQVAQVAVNIREYPGLQILAVLDLNQPFEDSWPYLTGMIKEKEQLISAPLTISDSLKGKTALLEALTGERLDTSVATSNGAILGIIHCDSPF